MSDVPADSSPAPATTPTTPTDILASLSPSEHLEWRQSGELPNDKLPVSPAASPTAEPAEQAVSTETTPPAASEPARPKRNADTRIQELLAKTKRLEAELEAARTQPVTTPAKETTPAASSPAPVGDKFPEYSEYLTKNPDATFEQWLDARDDFREQRKAEAHRRQETESALDRSHAEITADIQRQMNEALKENPDFIGKLKPEILHAKTVAKARADGDRIGPHNFIMTEVFKSSIVPQLAQFLSDHPEEYQRLQEVPERYRSLPDELQVVEHVNWIKREIGRLEGKLERANASASPTPKTVSSAPDPGTTLGSRPVVSGDAVDAAVRRRDPAAYMREANARELAAKKR